MSFLDKIKGKTAMLRNEDFTSIISQKTSTVRSKPNLNQQNLMKIASISDSNYNQSSILTSNLSKKPSVKNSQITKLSNVKNKKQNP